MSNLTDQDMLALDDVLLALRDVYNRAIQGTSVIKEMTGENMQEAYEGLALFGKRMMEFEDSLRNIHEIKRSVDLIVRASQMKARHIEAVDQYTKFKEEEKK